MPRRTYTFFNHAGGVGKTSTSRDFGYELASRGFSVLLVDLDPQGNLTSFLGADKWKLTPEDTLLTALLEDVPEQVAGRIPPILEVHGLHLLPATLDLAGAETGLMSKMAREHRLSNVLDQLPHDYDFVLIDSPPSLATLTVNALVAADKIISPVATRFKALDGLPGLMRMIESLRVVKSRLTFAAFVPTMYESRNNHDRDMLGEIRSRLSDIAPVLPVIRYRAADHNDASTAGMPVAVYKPNSEAAADMREAVEAFLQFERIEAHA